MGEAWSDADVRRLVGEARREALSDAREILRRRLAAELLQAAEAALSPPTATPPPGTGGTGLWVYGIAGGDAPAPPASLTGVDATPLRAIRHAGVTAYVSEVPLARFGADVLPEQLEDLGRVEALARAHEGVVDALLATTTVVPCRLCTIYEGPHSLQGMLDREQHPLRRTLERLAGTTEWGVKVLYDAPPAQRPAEVATGADYIAAKREARRRAEEQTQALDAVASEVHARLTEHADGAVVGRPQDPRLSGHAGEMLLNGAYLVPDGRIDAFRDVVDDLARQHADDGIRLELTGPWPPYHFAGEVPAA